MTTIPFRLPEPLRTSSSSSISLPSSSWLVGTWTVTHSSLPMWKDKRNVQITYKLLENGSFDNLVTYQSLSSTKISEIKGIETPDTKQASTWNWRGKGWLMIASSRWELLGWGGDGKDGEDGGEQWAVTYFAKTLFTPAGIDIYSKNKEGLSEEVLGRVIEGLKKLGEDEKKFNDLVEALFEVKRD